jgi:hypothetical protein
VTVDYDPPEPTADDVIFCRVRTSLISEDPDYDIVRYRYQWYVNGGLVRDVTSAALSDAVPRGVAGPGSEVTCAVTPSDGALSGPPTTRAVTLGRQLPVRTGVSRPLRGRVTQTEP